MTALNDPKNADGSRLLQRAFKLRFGLKLCLFTLLGGGALLALLHFSLSRSVGGSYGEAVYAIHDLKLRILPLIFASSYSIFVLAIVTAAVAVISVVYSHRIAGPLWRLERNIEIIGSGDLTAVTRFRRKDQLSVLSDDLNTMVRSLNHTTRSIVDALEHIREAEGRLREALEKGAPVAEETRAAIAAIREGVTEFKKAVACVKTENGRA